MDTNETQQDAYSVCGAPHPDCPAGFGSCDRPEGHDASHHCSGCKSIF